MVHWVNGFCFFYSYKLKPFNSPHCTHHFLSKILKVRRPFHTKRHCKVHYCPGFLSSKDAEFEHNFWCRSRHVSKQGGLKKIDLEETEPVHAQMLRSRPQCWTEILARVLRMPQKFKYYSQTKIITDINSSCQWQQIIYGLSGYIASLNPNPKTITLNPNPKPLTLGKISH